jgi:Saccharopine dehydrogenase NADP binding domain
MKRRVVVFGAAGHTARFVVAELLSRGWVPVLSGRDATALHGVAEAFPAVEVQPATIDDAGSLDRALLGCEAVINCAGPFGETAPALIEAALRARVHVLDVTGESLVAIETFATYGVGGPQAERVRQAGIVVAPAVGFYGALGDLLATSAMGDWPHADEVSIAVALDSWVPTRGTLLAGARRAGRRVRFAEGRLVVVDGSTAPPRSRHHFAEPFGEQEVVGEFSTVDVVTISRHLSVTNIQACLTTAPLADLSRADGKGPQAADASGRSAQRFVVEVEVKRGDEVRRAAAAGRDIYAITAPLVVEAMERILSGRVRARGTRPVGELFEARSFLEALAPQYLSWT